MPTELGHSTGYASPTPEEWVQWVREQPTVGQAVQVLDAYARQQVEAAAQHLEHLAQTAPLRSRQSMIYRQCAAAIRAMPGGPG